MMTHDEMIKVIQHHRDGGKVQYSIKNRNEFHDFTDGYEPIWDFDNSDYRAKPEPMVLWAEIMPGGYHIHSSLREFSPTNGGAIKKFIEEI
jgi:hypothetical protein